MTPRGRRSLRRFADRRDSMPDAIRERIHLACLPMEDVEENAAMVNAIQRSGRRGPSKEPR